MGIAISLHLLASVIWVGGMFFAFMFLRPAAANLLEAEQRFPLWANVFKRFFPLGVGIRSDHFNYRIRHALYARWHGLCRRSCAYHAIAGDLYGVVIPACIF